MESGRGDAARAARGGRSRAGAAGKRRGAGSRSLARGAAQEKLAAPVAGEGSTRLQKVLAQAGVASRRGAEALISAGRVRVAGQVVTTLGLRVDPARDAIEVGGRRVSEEVLAYVYFLKPRGVVSTMRDPAGRPALADYVKDVGARVVPVGRLDFQTRGVMLLTN